MRRRPSLYKTIIAAVAGLTLAISAPLAAQAADGDRHHRRELPQFDRAHFGSALETPTYAQEIYHVRPTIPLTSFTIQMKGSTDVVFRGIVYAWNGSAAVVGDALWFGDRAHPRRQMARPSKM